MNTSKTKIMTNRHADIVVNDITLETVPFYKYLGRYVNPESNLDKELNVRIGRAWGQLKSGIATKVWHAKSGPFQLNRRRNLMLRIAISLDVSSKLGGSRSKLMKNSTGSPNYSPCHRSLPR